MKELALETNSASLGACKPESILADWLRTITNFQSNYYQLVTCIRQKRIEQELRVRNTAYIGQCPKSHLVNLLSTMREELSKLDQDIDQLSQVNQSSTATNYRKLLIHTRVLKQLNQQAQNALYLATLSSS
jgi:hypothetical protein